MKRILILIFLQFITFHLFAQDNQINLLDSEQRIRLIDIATPIVIAFFGAAWTIIQSIIQAANTRAEVYNRFQEKFKEFQNNLPSWINNRDNKGNLDEPKSEKEKAEFNRTIESYWWLVFDEWVVCCCEAKLSCKVLWKKYYSKGVQNALERMYFKEALYRLVRKKNSFLGHDDDFLDEIKRLYKEKYNKDLF